MNVEKAIDHLVENKPWQQIPDTTPEQVMEMMQKIGHAANKEWRMAVERIAAGERPDVMEDELFYFVPVQAFEDFEKYHDALKDDEISTAQECIDRIRSAYKKYVLRKD